MIKDINEAIEILKKLDDYYYLTSKSVYLINDNVNFTPSDPFRHGFLSSLEKRKFAIKCLNEIDNRSRKILIYFYTFSLSVEEISKKFHLGIRQCYRLRKTALEELTIVISRYNNIRGKK